MRKWLKGRRERRQEAAFTEDLLKEMKKVKKERTSIWGFFRRRGKPKIGGDVRGNSKTVSPGKQSRNVVVADQIAISAAGNAVYQILVSFLGKAVSYQGKGKLRNEELLSSSLSLRDSMPRELKSEVSSLHERIYAAILRTAEKIEEKGIQDIEKIIETQSLGGYQYEKAKTLKNGQIDLQISYRSMSVALQIFCRLNQQLLDQMERPEIRNSRQEMNRLLLMNAVFVIEISDAIIQFMQKFSLEGIDSVYQVYEEIMEDLKRNEQTDQEWIREFGEDPNVSPDLKARHLEDIEDRRRFREIVRERWDLSLEIISEANRNIEKFKSKIRDLEAIRHNAKSQLEILEIAVVTGTVQANLNAVQSLLDISDLELKKLDRKTLFLLLGVQDQPSRMIDHSDPKEGVTRDLE